MVLAKNKKITIEFDTARTQDIYVSFDGDNHRRITQNDIITVKITSKALNIITAKDMQQLDKVDKKLKLR